MNILLIGNGISAKLLQKGLLDFVSEAKVKLSLDHVFNEKLYPPTSLYSTAHMGKSGISLGRGELGDLLLEAFFESKEFFKANTLDLEAWGITQGLEVFVDKEKDKIFQRFGECYPIKDLPFVRGPVDTEHFFLVPEIFLPKLDSYLQQRRSLLSVRYRHFLNKAEVNLNQYDLVLRAEGAWIQDEKEKGIVFDRGQKRSGSYLKVPLKKTELEDIFYSSSLFIEMEDDIDSKEAFLFQAPCGTLLYRKGELLVTSAKAFKNHLSYPALPSLWESWNFFAELFPKLKTLDVDQLEVLVGMRHRLPKRLPFLGPSDGSFNLFFARDSTPKVELKEKREFLMGGTYKNGFSLGFLAAKRLFLYLMECAES